MRNQSLEKAIALWGKRGAMADFKAWYEKFGR